ncbi:MAG: DNA primase [bacterium]
MNDAISEVKKRIDIVDFIGSFVNLKKAGRNFKAVCPFHQEKTASFVISPERQIWHCFGACGEGGDVIKFLMKWENLTFYEALKELAEKAGVKIQNVSFEDEIWKKKERLLKLNSLTSEYFNYILYDTKYGKKALEYLKSRDINLNLSKKFGIGYAPQSWDSLLKFLTKKKFNENELFEAGLVVKGKNKGFYDRFRGRIVFPITDSRGNIIAFSGRLLDSEAKEAKYINSPETPLYHKRESLYGINLAKDKIRKENNVYIVEGEFDAISMFQNDLENVVAIKGSAFTREQLIYLKRFTNTVTLALDSDVSGEEAIKRALDDAESLEFDVKIATIDFAKDPDEAVRKDLSKFKSILKESVSIYDFIINYAQKKHPDSDAFSKKNIANIVVPFLEKINNPIVLSHYVKKLTNILDVSEQSVFILINRFRQNKKQKGRIPYTAKKEEKETRDINIQKYVLSLMFQSKDAYNLSEKIFNVILPHDFSTPSFQKIAEFFLRYKTKNKNEFNINKFSLLLKPELRAVFDELYLYATYEADFEDENITKLISEMKSRSLKREIGSIIVSKESSAKKDKHLKELSEALKKLEKNALTL